MIAPTFVHHSRKNRASLRDLRRSVLSYEFPGQVPCLRVGRRMFANCRKRSNGFRPTVSAMEKAPERMHEIPARIIDLMSFNGISVSHDNGLEVAELRPAIFIRPADIHARTPFDVIEQSAVRTLTWLCDSSCRSQVDPDGSRPTPFGLLPNDEALILGDRCKCSGGIERRERPCGSRTTRVVRYDRVLLQPVGALSAIWVT